MMTPLMITKIIWLQRHHRFCDHNKESCPVVKEMRIRMIEVWSTGWMWKLLKKWSLTAILTLIHPLKNLTHLHITELLMVIAHFTNLTFSFSFWHIPCIKKLYNRGHFTCAVEFVFPNTISTQYKTSTLLTLLCRCV